MGMREKLIELIVQKQDCGLTHNPKGQDFVTYNAELADHLVANDVTIRKHSAWIFVNDRCGCRECRNCLSYDGNGVILDLSHLPYCPWCGAKMDGGTT